MTPSQIPIYHTNFIYKIIINIKWERYVFQTIVFFITFFITLLLDIFDYAFQKLYFDLII